MATFTYRVLALTAAFAVGQSALAQSGAKLPAPVALPASGTFSNTTSIVLRDADPGSEIRYTWDGSTPTAASPLYDPDGVLSIVGLYDGEKGVRSGYTLRAAAFKAGHEASDPALFQYVVARPDHTAYASEEIDPGVRMIRDADNDKMFLIRGTSRYVLIDSGMGHGALRDYVSQFTHGLPLVTIWTHSHGDHIGQSDQFIAGSTEYVGAPDRPVVAEFLARHGAPAAQIEGNLKAVADGDTIDLGDRRLVVYAVPGHTPGSIAVLDPSNGDLFTGDSFGSNSNLPPDVLWMQTSQVSLDHYYATVISARARLGNRVRRIMTGHNDLPLFGTAYLDNLETALQRAMDEGAGALVPSYRPVGLRQIVVGDRFTDPNWFGVNVNSKTFLPAQPADIAGLVSIQVRGASLDRTFDPDVHDYRVVASGGHGFALVVRPTSRHARALTLNRMPIRANVPIQVQREAVIAVTSPNGTRTETYRVAVNSPK